MVENVREPRPVERAEAIELIQKLQRMNLDAADYTEVRDVVLRLLVGLPLVFRPADLTKKIFRGRRVKADAPKLETLADLSYLPKEKRTSFGRCHVPGGAMFYGSVDMGTVFFEGGLEVGDRLYVSRWKIKKEFFIYSIAEAISEDAEEHIKRHSNLHIRDMVLTFLETCFTLAGKNKITAAVAEKLSAGIVDGGKAEVGAISYPSVKHPKRAENIAIRPEIVDSSLAWMHVQEFIITGIAPDGFTYKDVDFTGRHDENGKLVWTGKTLHWNVPPLGTFTFIGTKDGYIALDERGQEVDPG